MSRFFSQNLSIGMKDDGQPNIVELGNLEFKPVGSASRQVKSGTWLKFQIGYLLPLKAEFLLQYSVPKTLMIRVKASLPDDQIIVMKDDPLISMPENSKIVFRKNLEHVHWQKIYLPNLDRGFYFVKVISRTEGGLQPIKLSLLEPKKVVDFAGQSAASARKLGLNPKDFSTDDFLGEKDRFDFYHFSLKNPSALNLTISHIVAGNVLVKIMRDRGVIAGKKPPEIVHQSIITDLGLEHEDSARTYVRNGIQIQDKELVLDSIFMAGFYWISIERITGQIPYKLRLKTSITNLASVQRNSRLSYLVEKGFIPSNRFSGAHSSQFTSDKTPEFLSLHKSEQPYIDIRGVGDSAYSSNLVGKAPFSRFSDAVAKFDKDKYFYQGDVNVINWESVVTHQCHTYGGKLGFISSPDAIQQAILSGFHLFSLSNNHSRDCDETPESGKLLADGGGGEISTHVNMEKLAEKNPMVWSGISIGNKKKLVSSGIFSKGDHQFKVAFSSIDLGRHKCERSNCYSDRFAIAEALANEKADIKILTVHAREWLDEKSDEDNLTQLDKINSAMELFIGEYGVDIVFGSGPHSALPVRVINKKSGGKGIGFWSLGNFIHPNLLAKSHNMIGRVLFDLETRQPVQVQAVMLRTNKASAKIYDFDPSESLTSGIPWEIATDPMTKVKVGYFDLRSISGPKGQFSISNNAH